MIINEHISPNIWIGCFTHSCTNREAAILYAHIANCSGCRSIYEHGKNLRRRLNAGQQTSQASTASSAYLAVASATDAPHAELGLSILTVQINRSEAVFLADTIQANGYSEMYALNSEMNGKILRDDGDLLVMELRGDNIFFIYNDQVPAFATIKSDTPVDWIELKETTEMPLIPGDKLTIEIMFLA